MANKKNKKQNLGPKRKRMTRTSRLASAKEWIKIYEGKNIIKGYANWYGVDQICAMAELEMLGQPISETTKAKIKKSVQDRINQKRRQQEKRNQKKALLEEEFNLDSDETFSFIAGYTEGGVPYGITHEEWQLLEEREGQSEKQSSHRLDWWELETAEWLGKLEEEDWNEDPWEDDTWIDDDNQFFDYEYELTAEEIEELINQVGSNKNVALADFGEIRKKLAKKLNI